MKGIFNSLMLWGAALGGLITLTVSDMVTTSKHKGPGTVIYGDGDRHPEVEVVEPEREYKRRHFARANILLVALLGIWFYVANSARRGVEVAKAREKYLEAQLRSADVYQRAFASAVDAQSRERALAAVQSSVEFKKAHGDEMLAWGVHNKMVKAAEGDT